MKVLAAEFVTSAVIPRDGLPQIAFVGRSNVGKSSLINALCRRTIARTSAAPGKTRLANVYRVTLDGGSGGPGRWDLYLLDLPGYGYARGGSAAGEELRVIAEEYFGERLQQPGGTAVVLLVDSRHPGQASDLAAARWLGDLGLERHLVATKIDKLSRAERVRNLKELERTFGTAALPVSADSGEGLNELWQMIAKQARK